MKNVILPLDAVNHTWSFSCSTLCQGFKSVYFMQRHLSYLFDALCIEKRECKTPSIMDDWSGAPVDSQLHTLHVHDMYEWKERTLCVWFTLVMMIFVSYECQLLLSWHEMLLCKDTLLIHFPFSLLEEESHLTCIMRRSFSLSFSFSLTLADLHIKKLPRIRNETWSTLPDNRHAFTPIPILYQCTSDMYSFILLLHLSPIHELFVYYTNTATASYHDVHSYKRRQVSTFSAYIPGWKYVVVTQPSVRLMSVEKLIRTWWMCNSVRQRRSLKGVSFFPKDGLQDAFWAHSTGIVSQRYCWMYFVMVHKKTDYSMCDIKQSLVHCKKDFPSHN